MAHYKLGILLFVAGILFCTPSAFSRSGLPSSAIECDSLFLSNGTVFAIKNLSSNDDGISFAFCKDSSSQMHTAPWMQVHHIKKADGSIMESSAVLGKKPTFTNAELRVEEQVDNLYLMAVLSIPALLLFGLGIVLALIVLFKSTKFRKAVLGHPNERGLLRKIKRSRRIVKAMLFSLLLVGLIEIGYLIYLFSLFDKM